MRCVKKYMALLAAVVVLIIVTPFDMALAEEFAGFAGIGSGDCAPRVSRFGFKVGYSFENDGTIYLSMYDDEDVPAVKWYRDIEGGSKGYLSFSADTLQLEAGDYRLVLSAGEDDILAEADIVLVDSVDLADCVMSASEEDSGVKLEYRGYVLVEGVDYEIARLDDFENGATILTASGLGGYTGSVETETALMLVDISDAEVADIPGQLYTGDAITPRPAYVKLNGHDLKEGVDYTLEYRNNLNDGTAVVTVVGAGNYTGRCEAKFEITQLVQEIQMPSNILALKKGKSKIIDVTVLPDNAGNKSIIWTSTDTTIATVDAEGRVEGLKKGAVTIIAAAADGSGVSAQSMLFVLENMPKSVKMNKSSAALRVGSGVQLSATVWPEEADIRKVIWTSSDTSVARVSSKGWVTAVSAGKAVITAKTVNGKTSECKITVKK